MSEKIEPRGLLMEHSFPGDNIEGSFVEKLQEKQMVIN